MVKLPLSYSLDKAYMAQGVSVRFMGETKDVQSASSQRWKVRCKATARRPFIRAFAERWVKLMEERVNSHVRVRHIAEETMQQVRQETYTFQGQKYPLDLTDMQVREVILMLYNVWACGSSLHTWGRERGILGRND